MSNATLTGLELIARIDAKEDAEAARYLDRNATLTLKDRVSSNRIYLTLRDGVVVGAMGADPARYVGLMEAAARRKARYGQR